MDLTVICSHCWRYARRDNATYTWTCPLCGHSCTGEEVYEAFEGARNESAASDAGGST